MLYSGWPRLIVHQRKRKSSDVVITVVGMLDVVVPARFVVARAMAVGCV